MNVLQASAVDYKSLTSGNVWAKVPEQSIIDKTAAALVDNGFDVEIVETKEEAKAKVLSLIPQNAEVMTMSSETLETLGVPVEINESGKYDSVKQKLMAMDREKDGVKMKKIGAAPEWAIGSVHAITQDGKVLIASNTGSQLGAYVYGSGHVIWVVGAQKIVRDLDSAFDRLNEYTLPLEAVRINKVYGASGSYPSKILIVNQEIAPKRIKIILIKENLGF